jgi:Protein of unknown function (DUF2283)
MPCTFWRDEEAIHQRVDQAADAIYLNLTDRPIKDGEEVAEGIVADYDAQGHVIGVENPPPVNPRTPTA